VSDLQKLGYFRAGEILPAQDPKDERPGEAARVDARLQDEMVLEYALDFGQSEKPPDGPREIVLGGRRLSG